MDVTSKAEIFATIFNGQRLLTTVGNTYHPDLPRNPTFASVTKTLKRKHQEYQNERAEIEKPLHIY